MSSDAEIARCVREQARAAGDYRRGFQADMAWLGLTDWLMEETLLRIEGGATKALPGGNMTPLVVLELIKEGLRLLNNLIEGKPEAQRQAEALVAWSLFKPVVWSFLPKETREAIDGLMQSVVPAPPK